MTDNHNPALDHDPDLAEFTDMVFNRQPLTVSGSQNEKGLQEVIMALHANITDEPPADVKQRIKAQAQAAYTQTYTQKRSLLSLLGFGQRGDYRSISQRQRTAAVQLAVAAVVVTTILVFTVPSTLGSGGQTGTAFGEAGWWLPLGIFLLGGAAIIWLWFRNRD